VLSPRAIAPRATVARAEVPAAVVVVVVVIIVVVPRAATSTLLPQTLCRGRQWRQRWLTVVVVVVVVVVRHGAPSGARSNARCNALSARGLGLEIGQTHPLASLATYGFGRSLGPGSRSRRRRRRWRHWRLRRWRPRRWYRAWPGLRRRRGRRGCGAATQAALVGTDRFTESPHARTSRSACLFVASEEGVTAFASDQHARRRRRRRRRNRQQPQAPNSARFRSRE